MYLVLLELLKNDKISAFYISYRIGLIFVHIFYYLVYVVGWKWNCNVGWNI